MTITIIGGGAAGCFCSIEIKRRLPSARVIVLEAQDRTLAKVAITGGGRCNLTNTFEGVDELSKVYPRGHRLLTRVFHSFNHQDCMRWFESEGVSLVVQDDHCVFPRSQDAMQIVRTLQLLMRQSGIEVFNRCKVTGIRDCGGSFEISVDGREKLLSDYVVVTIGGRSRGGQDFLSPLDLKMVDSVPSLFSFNIDCKELTSLMGTVVKDAVVSLSGTRLSGRGELLITHWGISGPAVLRLSSYAARELALAQYRASVQIRWCADAGEEELRETLLSYAASNPGKLCGSLHPAPLPSRLWEHLLRRAGLRNDLRWGEIGSKGLSKLVSTLMADTYTMSGKSRWKEEFVTCGGVALCEVNPSTLECRKHPALYFAGEVLDIDGVTGGFNLQAAWSTGYVAACNIFSKFVLSK